ncbi:hypothetical protein ACLOJK_019231 [Asimina triloba]
MAVSPSTSVAWAWVLEALSQVKDVDLETLNALLKAVPDLEEMLKVWKSAEERLALRFLEDGIASNLMSDSGEPVEIYLPLDSVSGINAIKVLEKLVSITVYVPQEVNQAGFACSDPLTQLDFDIDIGFLYPIFLSLSLGVTFISSAPKGKIGGYLDKMVRRRCISHKATTSNGKKDVRGAWKPRLHFLVLIRVHDTLELKSVIHLAATVICRKVETSGSLVKCGSEMKEAIGQFIMKRKATLPKCAIQKLQDYVIKAPPRKGKFIGDSSCNIDTAQELMDNGEIQPVQQNSASFICEIRNEAFQKPLHEFPTGDTAETTYVVQPQHKFVDQANDGFAEGMHEVNNQYISASGAQDGAVETNMSVEESPLAQNLDEGVGCAEHVLVPETSSSTEGEHQTISDDERLGKGMFSRSLNVLTNDSLAIDWTESDDYCIKCEEGGQLLSCRNSSCLFAVHESCLGLPIIFEDDGSYYCPFCSYTRAYAAYRKAKNKVSMTWRAMTAFNAKYPLHQKCKKSSAEFPSKSVEARNMRNSSPSKVAENSPISKKHSCGRGKDAKGLQVSDAPGLFVRNVDEETTGNLKNGMKFSSERGLKHQRPAKR